MSQEVGKWLGSMGYNLLINGVYWGYNPLTNLLLISWDIQVRLPRNANGSWWSLLKNWIRVLTAPETGKPEGKIPQRACGFVVFHAVRLL